LWNYTRGIVERLGVEAGWKFAMVQPLTVDASVTTVYGALVSGGRLQVISRERSVDAAGLAEYMGKSGGADYLKCAPSHLAALQGALGEEEFKAVLPRRCLMIGGEASTAEWVKSVRRLLPEGCLFVNHYGPTETTVGVLTYGVEAEWKEERGVTPLGRPLGNTRAYVVDEAGEAVPVGVGGELWIGGENVTRGYWGSAEQTAERYVPDGLSGVSGGRL